MKPCKAIALGALAIAACAGSTTTVGPTADESRTENPAPKGLPDAPAKTAEQPEIEAEVSPPEAPIEPPKLERLAEHFVVVAPSAFEEALVVPGGVAFVQSEQIWIASRANEEVRMLEDPIDPHGLATDGSQLYWLGHERNGQIELASGEKGRFVRIAPPGRQRDLAFGDVAYGVTDRGQVWRVDGMHVSRVDTHMDRQWQSLPVGFGAGDHVVVLPLRDVARGETFLWRARVGGKGVRVETKRVQPVFWSVRADGTLLFVRGEQVFRLGAKSNKPRLMFEEPRVSAVCWCGKSVCTFVESSGELRIHRKGATETRPLAPGLETPIRVSCDAEHVAWRVATGEGTHRLGVIAL